MVIHHFNRIIRNKWLWGAFAVTISVFFAFDFLFTGRDDDSRSSGTAGTLGSRDVTVAEFRALADDVRGFGRQRNRDMAEADVNRRAWEELAALEVARSLHLTATDDEVRAAISHDPSFRGEGGGFNMRIYELVLRENGLTPEHFEAYLKRRLTLMKLSRSVLGAAAWVSPMELEGAINDVTDKFTVRVASFTDRDGAKVKLDDAGLEAYYRENTNSIALPDCITVKYVKYQADDAKRLAQFKITEDEMRDRYDATSDRFETQTTNGVITKKFEEVKGILEKELQLVASIEAYRTNLLFRVYPNDASVSVSTVKVDRLERIAAEDKAKVRTSPPFSPSGTGYVAGFMSRPEAFAPGVDGFLATAAELDPDSEDLRYGVVAGTNAVYLVERASFIKAHVPTFAEAKSIIRPRALAAARAKAFKESVEKQRALAAAAIAKGQPFDAKALAAQSVTTSITFSVSSLQRDSFADSRYVSTAAMKLGKGQLSEFIATSNPTRGLLVYVENRVPGDAADAQMVRAQLRDELSSVAAGTVPAAWNRWNLERLGFTTTQISSVEVPDEGAVSED
ncbi:MAG: SurA N-terminal domain-containing protein [Kiritimatiellae bacterium]|nr:SurA N-terminal domain-containing protein [Kiritimatiellia bacterium]